MEQKLNNKFTISQLYKGSTLTQIEDTFNLTEDIIKNLDEYALKELCEGYSYDVDKLFLDIISESNQIINSGGGIQSFSFNYLTSLTNSLDEYLKKLSFAYFVDTCLSDFNIETYHLEWFNMISLYRNLCVLAARGHSKSYVFSFAYPLWLMYKYEGLSKVGKELTIITAEGDLAGNFVEKIKEEVENNPILKEKIYPGTNSGKTWAKTTLQSKNGFKLGSKGLNSSLRGLHTDVICDDILDESNFYNGRVREETKQLFNNVIMNIPLPRTGKVTVVGCVSPNTFVLDKEKGFCRIIELLPQGKDKFNKGLYELNNKVLDSYNNFIQNTKFWVNGKCHTSKVILDNNYHIIGSDIHPIWCFEGVEEKWKRIPELKVGDIVEIKNNEEPREDWGKEQEIILPNIPYSEFLNMPKYLNKEIAYLLGVFCAEGNLHNNGKQVCITNCEIDFSFTKKYNIEFNCYKKGEYYCSRKIFREWLSNIFGENCHAENKKIPDIILKSSKNILRSFLRGLFDGDGSCTKGMVSYTTVSYILKEQLQSVLSMCFGINTKVYTYTKEERNKLNKTKANFDTYNFSFDGYNSKLFLNRIGFNLKRKQNYGKGISEENIVIPTPVELLRKIKCIAQKEYKIKLEGNIPEQILKRNGYLTKKRLNSIYSYFNQYFTKEEDKKILNILKNYTSKVWRRIEKIEDNGEEYTYDFVIPSHNIFIGNGIKNHQTCFHEQDLYAMLKKSPGWRVFEYPGIYPDGSVLSPERFSLKELIDKKKTIGSLSFAREILMQPISNTTSLFPFKIMKMNLDCSYQMFNNKFNIPFKLKRICFGVDLAVSANTDENSDRDYFVVAIIGLDENNRYWLLNYYRDKGLSYNKQMEVVKRLNECFKPDLIMVESNQYQKMFADLLRNNGLDNVQDRATTAKNKYDFSIGLPAVSVLFEQFRLKIPYAEDTYTRNHADLFMAEFNSMTFNDNKLQSSDQHDDICMATWLGITAINTTSDGITLSFLEVSI